MPAEISVSALEALFDRMPDVVFFVKDRQGRYAAVNQTLLERCAASAKRELSGPTTAEIFDPPLGGRFLEQDRQVLEAGVEIRDRLELHLYRSHRTGWCLTNKVPLWQGSEVVGLIGLSKDLQLPDEAVDPVFERLARRIDTFRQDLSTPLGASDLAREVGVTRPRLARCVKRVFGLSPRQLLAKVRLDSATELLRSRPDWNMSEIAHACGYRDHSAFSRHFKSMVGIAPSEFRRLRQPPGGPS